jgi:hypothetical protein
VTIKSPGILCKSKSATRRKENPLLWDVVCEFDSTPDNQQQDPSNPDPDPSTWLTILTVNFENRSKRLLVDAIGGDELLNSAGDPFDHDITVDYGCAVIPFVQYEKSSMTLKQILDRHNKKNSQVFKGFSRDSLLCTVRSAELMQMGRYKVWKVSYQLNHDPEDRWIEFILDIGTHYKDAAGNRVPFLDLQGHRRIGGLKNGVPSDPPGIVGFNKFDRQDFSFIRTT